MSRKLALIIGNSEYQDSALSQLKSPEVDVRKLSQILRDPNIGAFDDVILLMNPLETEVRRQLVRFFDDTKKPDDLLLLYFSGHGIRHEHTNRLFLTVKDTEKALLSATAIAASFISDLMDECRSNRQVLILDCCHSGAFLQGTKGAIGESVGTASQFQGQGFGRVILTATDATQYAFEGDKINVIGTVENSVFTHQLIRGIESGEADRNQDGFISLDEWYDFAFAGVRNQTSKQTPGKWSFKQQGDIIIAKNPHPSAQLPPELQEGIKSPNSLIRLAAVEQLAGLLNSNNPGMRLAAQKALRLLSQDDSKMVESAARKVLPNYEEITKYFPAQEPLSSAHKPSLQPPVVPKSSTLQQKAEEANKLIEQLGQKNSYIPALRGNLNKWRSETAAAIKLEIGIAEALKFGDIGISNKIRGERESLLDLSQRCRQFLLQFLPKE
jgi:hypothetical protein